MANEIEISVSISASKSGMTVNRAETFKVDMSGESMIHGVQNVGTSIEVLDLAEGSIGTSGWCFIKNLDSTNYIDVGRAGVDADEHTVKLKAGESCVFRAAGVLYGKSNTAALNIEYIVIED
jgi:hypothetical protein